VRHYCRNEWVRRLEDLMIRRTSWRHYRHDHAEVAAGAAQWMAAELGWDDATTETEVLNYRKQHGTNGAPPPHMFSNGETHAKRLAGSTSSSQIGKS
jgi:glycerol-3-phosphate dehydrogenase